MGKDNRNFGFLANEAQFAGGGVEAALKKEGRIGLNFLLNHNVLPSDTVDRETWKDGKPVTYSTKEALEKGGVKFGDVSEKDVLFQEAELPKGWKKVSGGQFSNVDVLDERDRRRAIVFFKDEPHDRRAYVQATGRFSCDRDMESETRGVSRTAVTDAGGKVLFEATEEIPVITADSSIEDIRKRGEVHERMRGSAEAWLNEHYPDWEDPGAYWEEE